MKNGTITRPDPKDFLAQLSTGGPQKRAKELKLSLSQLCVREMPVSDEERRDGMDSFGLLLDAANIGTISDPEAGYQADLLESFERSADTKQLFPEWVRRQWTKAQGYGVRSNAEYLSADYLPNTIMNPAYTDGVLRQMQIQPAIPLAEVVARTMQIDREDYRSLYLVEPPADQVRLIRIAEAAELPRVKIATSQRSIRLHKFGRAIEASYELLRRQPIDLIAVHIQRIGIQSQVDQVAAAIDVMVNGDGNSGTSATVYNLTTLDAAAVAGTLTAKAWLAFRMKWINPYYMTRVLARSDIALQVEMLTFGNNFIPLAAQAQFGGVEPINQSLSSRIRMGITDDAPASKIVGFDSRFGIERVIETGSLINETERWIQRQVEILTMSENEAFATFDSNAVKILNVAA